MERKKGKNNENLVSSVENGEVSNAVESRSNIKGDEWNIVLLLFLYTLQGIPLGLSSAIPMILQNRGVSYKQQAEFSFVYWPFSLKLLWAPLVDAFFSAKLGRRKSWLIPTQYLIGFFMLVLSSHVNQWLGDSSNAPNIGILTLLFFLLNFLAATQDIAVDGWALTMLKKCNVGHASTCNSIGQSAGFFLSYVVFMALESPNFCNTYLRSVPQDEGLVTLPSFFYYWGWIFIISTTIVGLIKSEVEPHDPDHAVVHDRDIKTAYNSLKSILTLPAIKTLVLILISCKIGFSSTDNVMTLKLVEAGIPKEKLGLMAIPLIPVQLILPIVIAKYTTGPKPLNIFLKAIPYRLIFGIIAAFLVWITPTMVPDSSKGLPIFYVILLIGCYALHQVCVYAMFVSIMAFFAKISDSSVGGTYMTLLNTVTNLGGNWPAMLALYFVDPLTWKECVGADSLSGNMCKDAVEKEECINSNGKCVTTLDGFYIETVICTVIGFIWLMWGEKKIQEVQSLDENAWKLQRTKKDKR
ncbi:acetyl-coenzyme A transporter 1 [Sitophilus oryzae]|uniref:Acetyl-coenzyme A transporter 1 n=1 Tax=Sitophilus oryzae TaxID=7048 RepID=A0A6J2XJY7_SITOR|nr:acetyl-coenzyme A transporter 1 [Sitophilus oryzae]XP_030751813.1 acetyl-coenzyme A transporter 1 [Sitophilus oryzae]